MSYVWLANDLELDAYRALKFVTGVYEDEAVELERLRKEAARTQELTHEHIIRTYDFVRDGRLAAVSMEYVDGITLKQYLQCLPHHCFKVVEIRDWVEQLCLALAYAHAQGIVHLDLKPANIMISRCGRLKVADFGISQSLKEPPTGMKTPASGTPAYMSPQQRGQAPSSIADDIYALGATLYHLLSGAKPGAKNNPMSAACRHGIPMNWERVIDGCLAERPSDRPRSIVDVARHLGFDVRRFAQTASAARFDPRILRAQSELHRNQWEDDLEPTVVEAAPAA